MLNLLFDLPVVQTLTMLLNLSTTTWIILLITLAVLITAECIAVTWLSRPNRRD